jgi:hypothetical protein
MAKTQSTRRGRSSASLRTTLYAAALCFASGEAMAVTLPCCGVLSAPVITTNNFGAGASGGAQAEPTVAAWAAVVAGPGYAAAAASVVTDAYDFVVLGPSGATAPLTIDAFAAYSATGVVTTLTQGSTLWGASAAVSFEDDPVVTTQTHPPGALAYGHVGVLFANVIVSAIYTITVSAEASANNQEVNAVTDVIAYADPQVSFAPGFNSTGYSLEFSPGVGNGPPRDSIALPIPEPGTLTLVGLGGAGLLARVRRRREQRMA